MPWCHLFLMMPLFGLALFVFLPWWTALPLYLLISVVSLLIYTKIIKALHAPVATGREGMIGKEAEVVSAVAPHGAHESRGLISYHGELWGATSEERFRPGERVRIIGVEGTQAIVSGLDRDGEGVSGNGRQRHGGHSHG